ncbi:multidrug effflux MFS transporter [Puniceibacterium sp. IMCC21224]|uniref:multidrug effflux MFS transporter n=1 Tax=Puniceibacterium sp. IMCC21224 TaxID=1618204 RepID=UPI00064E009C|nr:multidrug effflux MFS transporter [Puniceibacterium sp. IMCC21224]KMK67143.1 arabinose efflux permease family protein [Puniceibacterium sp. IMCC21224]
MPLSMSRTEFIALIAMMFATIAFSIDSMLPALPAIGATLSPNNLNAAQLVITSFMLGMGVGTFFTGPLSDTFGRKPVVLAGVAIYIVAALVASQAQSLEVMLAARVVQGLGAAGPRVVALAIIRDLFDGRSMARIMSFVMIIFTLVPALAPSMGAVIIAYSGWRAVFVAFVVFAIISTLWFMIRLPETLAPENRRPFRLSTLTGAVREMLSHPTVRLSIAVQSLSFGMLFSMISSTQQIFDVTFGRAESFPLWFGGIAIAASSASFLNALLVMRLGMRLLVTVMLAVQLVITTLMITFELAGAQGTLFFAVFVVWQASLFFQAGMTIGNLNAMAMEPMGHIAGMAASVTGAISTVAAVMLSVPVGLMFDGTPLPLAVGVFVEVCAALILMLYLLKAERAAGLRPVRSTDQ